MSLRSARDNDFMACVTLSRKAWPAFRERESIYHLFCKFFSSTCFVSEGADGALEGFVLGFLSQVDSSEAYIHLVAVDPSVQHRGIATSLYRAFFARAAELGARRVRLIVNPDNAASLRFHHRLGFTPDLTGRTPDARATDARTTDARTIELDGVLAVADYNGPGIHMVPYVRALERPLTPESR